MRVLAGILAVFCCLALAGVVIAWHALSGISFPQDGATAVVQPTTARTVYRSVAHRAGGDDRHVGVRYGCAQVAAGRAYRCVVPGGGAGDRRYRVTVDRGSCWTARRAGTTPAHGCLRTVAAPD
jgi:hypothetical protein